MPQRTLSEQEFNAIRDRLYDQAPSGMSEQEFMRWMGPRFEAAIGEAENSPAPQQGSALRRFATGAAEMLNPVALAKGVYGAVTHPIDTATGVLAAQGEQLGKAAEDFKQGRYVEALGHGTAGVLPLVGPAAAEAGEQIASGDVAGGLGKGAGLLLPVAGAEAVRGIKSAVPAGVRATAANALEKSAAAKVVDVMAPKVGANKVRLGNTAAKVAPELLEQPELSAWSREGYHAKVKAGLADAEKALDAAQDARLEARTFPTEPIINDLIAKRKQFTSQAVEGSKATRTATERTSAILDERGQPIKVTELSSEPIGKDVVPAPNRARVAQIDQAINELKQLGGQARYEDLRRIRQSYDGPARAVYSPSVTADYLKVRGESLGAADVTGTLRERLAQMDPQTAAANQQYSIMRSANDVLEAAAEVERTRPKVGRKIMSRLTGVMVGSEAAGAKGAVAGMVFGPAIDYAMNSGWSTQVKTAALMKRLAKSIRAGEESGVVSALHGLQRLSAQATALSGRLTSPSGSQTQTTVPAWQ